MGIAIFALFMSASGIFAGPVLSVKYSHYTLKGQSAEDIEQDVLEGNNLNHFDGILPGSTWLVRWTYDFEEKDQLCKLKGVTTRVEISRARPIWKKAKSLEIKQKKAWEDYLVHLDANDAAQQEVVLKAADEIEQKISRLKPQKSCSELGAAANMIGQGVLAKYRGLEIRTDIKGRLASAAKPSQ